MIFHMYIKLESDTIKLGVAVAQANASKIESLRYISLVKCNLCNVQKWF